MFSRYALRTTEVEDARRFYERALGLVLPSGSSETAALEAWPLHERARQAGAPPHWLGHLDVDDLDARVKAFVAAGAQALGPTVRSEDGRAWATLRDPFGSVVALREKSAAPGVERPIAWHQLHTTDLERAWATYAKLGSWFDAGTIDVPSPEGGHRLFAWTPDAEAAGSVANTARWPGVHPHWLFHFVVEDVDVVAARVRRHGGSALEPTTLARVGRLTACEDPQGGAFGLIQLTL